MKRTMGIVRNKTLILTELRSQKRHTTKVLQPAKGSRFSKQRLGGIQQFELGVIDHNQTMKKPFIEEDLSTVNTIQPSKPTFMVQYEQCQLILRGVDDLRKEMLVNQNRRLTCVKVSEEKGYQMRIYECAKQATGKIKRCQHILDLIRNQNNIQTSAQNRVCDTIALRLANDIQQSTKKLRAQQKSFVQQRKQFEMTDKPNFLELAVDQALNMGDGFDDLVEDEAMRDLQQRSEQIKKIVESVYELNDIYKQLNDLVVLQGSLLDRIDQNIEKSSVAVSKGLGHLQKANKRHKKTSRCACITTLILLLLNAIVLIILCKKWL